MQFARRGQLLFGVASVVLLCLMLLIVKNASTQPQTDKKNQQPDPVVAALRRGGLREAAKMKGHYVGTTRTAGWMKYDIESLVSSSSVVIIGTPFLSSSNLAGTDRIETEFKARVDRILKGELNDERFVNVIVPGGKVRFEDGTSAEIKTPDLGPIELNQKYVFFLKPSDDSSQVFYLTGGGQGLFKVLSDSRVKPLGDKADIVQRHKYQTVDEFIDEISAAVRKYPATLPCCD